MRIKKNDIVEVITGKNRGKTGKVLRVYPERNKVLVEGVNNQFKHERPSAKNQQGGITTREAPVDASNVMLVDPKTSLRTRIGKREFTSAEGKVRFERYSKRSGDLIG
ncbi:MAG TPA: 50S ribosomal protein L24 [Candidatus Kapabacteria bacterium]|nr:50S ribosomal protein L24 [Candidatus Kapabacteria bacterium]